MKPDHMTPEQVAALGKMNKKVHDEYRNLGYAGVSLDPARFLAFRQQTRNDRFTELVVSDAGVFFMDSARRVKFKFHRDYFLVYHEGFHLVDEEKIRKNDGPVVILDNLLELWNRPGTGLCLVADHLNNCDYLMPEQKKELDRVQALYDKQRLVINPMLQKKAKEEPQLTSVSVLDLED
ncbi:MAG TPA: hypothetical protein VMV05_01990 [bacterium]|nr:hypothetical protein [bacterium]